MLNTILEYLLNPFVQSALFATLLGAMASGLVAPYIVVKRLNLLSGTLAHTLLGGVGLALWIESTFDIHYLSPLTVSLFFAVLTAIALTLTQIHYRHRLDAVMAMLWSFGMSIGVILIVKIPQSNIELNDYLFGSVLWITQEKLLILALTILAITGFILIFYKQLFLICFDEQAAITLSFPFKYLYMMLMIMISLVIVILMESMGIILAMTLLTLPALIASSWTKKFHFLHLLSIALSLLLSSAGFLLAAIFNLPLGASIALTCCLFYMINLLIIRP